MKKKSEKQWSEKIKQHHSSGKSARLWCQEQGLSYQSFLSWRKRLPAVDITKGSPFVEIFEDTSESTWMEISTKGAKLILAKKFNRESLTRLLQVLREL